MAKRKDSEATTLKNQTAPAKTTIAPEVAGAPLPVDAPKMASAAVEPMAELLKIESFKSRIKDEETAQAQPETQIEAAAPPSPIRRYAPLAASVALAALLGAIAGAAATAAFAPRSDAAASATSPAAEETRALKETMVRLSSELATVKASVDTANRGATSQFNKLADRFDRAEKAQAEPAAKLAKIVETLDRIERRPVTQAAVVAAPEVTGAVSVVEKQQSKPAVAEGWKLLEFYGGRAVVENRAGGLYEVGPGSSLPGLGKVETIKREDGRVIVVTPKGIIVSSLEQRRQPHYLPYRY